MPTPYSKASFAASSSFSLSCCAGAGRAELGCPAELRWDGQRALFQQEAVGFIVNRSTDFFWQGQCFAALRSAYRAGSVLCGAQSLHLCDAQR